MILSRLARPQVSIVVAALLVLAMILIRPAGAELAAAPGYTNYTAPSGLGQSAGEPSLGVNWNTGNVMYQAGAQTLKVSFNDLLGTASWSNVSFPTTGSGVSLDPILFTDPVTGETAVSQLVPPCSISAVTPDDGANWKVSSGCSIPGGADHQTIGGGPLTDGLSVGTAGHGMYYCAQDLVASTCGLSRDGGLTYGPAVPVYTFTPFADMAGCGGLHGHIKVARDGTAYLPNQSCNKGAGPKQAVVVTENDGLTWSQRLVPDAPDNGLRSDPSVAIGSDGTVYFAYEDASGLPKVAVSRDKGKTWTPSFDLGTPAGVKYAVFPAAVAGDGDRAAVAFLGATQATSSPDTYEDSKYNGVWHLYVSTTYDRGVTWQTVDVTPNDPVQRGCVYWGNGSCPSAQRNLLDFMDAGLDRNGRVVVGYADGCTGSCVNGGANTRSDVANIARQTSGDPLFVTPPPVAP